MSYLEEEYLFKQEENLQLEWNAHSVFIFDNKILVETNIEEIEKVAYIPFVYNNKLITLSKNKLSEEI